MPFLGALKVVYDDALYKPTFILLYFTLRYLLTAVYIVDPLCHFYTRSMAWPNAVAMEA